MIELKINKNDLLNADVIDNAIEDNIIGQSRWSIYHSIIFEFEGKFYQAQYSVGATECQEEYPWEDIDEVECTEVEQRDVIVKQWFEKDIKE